MMTIRRLLVSALGCAAGAALLAMTAAQRGYDGDFVIQRWLVLEPIPIQIRSNAQLNDSFVQTTIKTDYFPGQYTVIPHDGDKVTVNGNELVWHAVDTSVYHVNLYHFAHALNKPTFNILSS